MIRELLRASSVKGTALIIVCLDVLSSSPQSDKHLYNCLCQTYFTELLSHNGRHSFV